jgi:uncharacterized SAM-binding protein YcdF (DUF218 family)
MFFHCAKLLYFILRPSNALLLAVLLGCLALVLGDARVGLPLLSIGVMALVVLGWTPLPYLLLRPLEDAHPIFDRTMLADHQRINGIILLGGGINAARGDQPNGPIFTGAGSRVITTLELADRFPDVPILLSGGTAALHATGLPSEAGLTRDLLLRLGIAGDRLQLEEGSRDTFENARESRRFLAQEAGRWLLVTSAAHMPRALASFGELAPRLIPCPADFKTQGKLDRDRYFGSAAHGLLCADVAAHEWLGLLAYRLSGRIDRLPRLTFKR